MHPPVLLIGQIGEAVEAELEGAAGDGVLLLDVPEIILEDLEPLLLLAEGIVRLAVLHDPRLVRRHQLAVGGGVSVGDDGHVGGPCLSEEERKEEREEEQGVCSHG